MPGREDVTDLLNGVGEAAAMMSPDPNSGVLSPQAASTSGPSNLQEEMSMKSGSPQTNFSPNFSVATEEPIEPDHGDTALRDRRLRALERNRRLKRAARERKAQRDRKKAEDEQVDLGVRMRLLNMGLGEDEAAYLMRDYETRWTRDDVQLRVRRRVAMDDEEDGSSEDEQEDDDGEDDEDDEAMDEIHGLDNLLDDGPERDRDVFGGRSDHDQVDYDLQSSGASDNGMDDTLQTPRRTVSTIQAGFSAVAVLMVSPFQRRDSRASTKRPSLREIPPKSKSSWTSSFPIMHRNATRWSSGPCRPTSSTC
jgi:hypothetical protein